MEALPREDDPYRSDCEEGEPRDEDDGLEESYLLAAPGDPAPERFAVGGTADAMAPGPVLAILADRVQREGLGQLDDDQLTGVLQAAGRLAVWSAALKLAARSRLAARREAAGRETGDWRPFDHADDEVAVALTLTRRSAGRLLDLALSLDRLPLTRAVLAAGQIDERRAEVITEELAGLDDAHAAAAEALIIAKAPALTSGQLRALARRLVSSADPAAARRRKEQALKDARVESFTEHAGTAALSGRDLCPVDVLAADKHLTVLAQAMKAPGNPHGSALPATSPGLRGTVNLTMPLSAWLGWTQSPGEVPGSGPLDAGDSRTLATLLSHNPANRWCITLTSPAGHPLAHACARAGPDQTTAGGPTPRHPAPRHHPAPEQDRSR